MRIENRIPRAVAAVGLAVALFWGAGHAAAAPYAGLFMDMRTGEIIEERNANNRQQPASLTKMMTLYLTFEAIKTGQIGLDQKVRVSRHASRQPASKLYLKAGQRVTIRHLIRAAAIKSANDAAMVLAETIGGSQREFARLMTAKARELGMTRTTFKNPHGLTQPGHLSTARDMAKLARAIYFDHPEYYNVFGKRYAYAAGKRVYSTNRLLSTYSGAEGMKTGYTRAAGYNLVATAKRGSRRVLAVIMGGKSSRWRNAKMKRLLNEAFAKTPRYAAEVAPRRGSVQLAVAPLPDPRPVMRATGLGAVAEALGNPAAAATPDVGSDAAPLYGDVPRTRPTPDRPAAGARRRAARTPGSLVDVPVGSAAPVPTGRPGWSVQVGAFNQRERAVAHLNAVSLGDLPALASAAPVIRKDRMRSGKSVYKVRFVGLDKTGASTACAEVKKAGQGCLAIAPR